MSEDRIRVAVNGAAGRMGQRVVAACVQDPSLELVGAVEASHSQALGADAGEKAGVGPLGVIVRSELDSHAQVVIDFSGLTTPLTTNKTFTLEIKPPQGSYLVVQRTTPASINQSVINLN